MGSCPSKFSESSPSSSAGPPGYDAEDSSTTINPSDTSSLSEFERNILHYHNVIREANGLDPLVWDTFQAQKASDWANFLKNNNQCALRHPDNTQQERDIYLPDFMGQNLYVGHGYPDNPANANSAISSWYNECSNYKPPIKTDIPTNFEAVGHFTQVTWKDATKLGCAVVDCPKKMKTSNDVNVETKGSIIACNYDKGNVGGQFNDMVPTNAKCVPDNPWIRSIQPATTSAIS